MEPDPSRTQALILSYEKDVETLWRKFYRRAMRQALQLIPVHADLAAQIRHYGRRRKFTNGVVDRIMDVFEEAEEVEIRRHLKELTSFYSRQAYVRGKQRNIELMQHLGVQVHFGMTPRDLEALSVFADRGLRLLGNDIEDMNKAIMQAISQGILKGESMNKIAQGINEAVAGDNRMGLDRAKLIARTEVIQTYGTAAINAYREAGLKEWEWVCAIDDRTCPICKDLDGKRFSVDVPFESHPNCRCTPRPVVPSSLREEEEET